MTATPDRIALAIEMMRVAALSTYENQPISTGVLLLGTDEDPVGHYPAAERDALHYTGALASIKSFYRLADGLRTVFLVNRAGRLLDIVDIDRWAGAAGQVAPLDVPCAQTYSGHARATVAGPHVCVVLNPRREIKVFAEGAQVFSFSHADWRLLDQTSKYALWQTAVGNAALAERVFRTALDLSDARQGALFVVLRRPDRVAGAARGGHRPPRHGTGGLPAVPGAPSRRDLLHLLAGRTITELDPSVLAALATLDGATVTDADGTMLAVGAILRHPLSSEHAKADGLAEGARTTAAHRRQPLRPGAEGQRGRPHHLLRRRPQSGICDPPRHGAGAQPRRPSKIAASPDGCSMQVFLTGGTGYIGAAVLDALIRSGHHVTALVRDPEKAARLEARGATPVMGELASPARYLKQAAAADAVVHTAFESSPRGPPWSGTFLDAVLPALAAAGAPRVFLYTSGIWVLGAASRTRPMKARRWRPCRSPPGARRTRRWCSPRASATLRTAVMRPGHRLRRRARHRRPTC